MAVPRVLHIITALEVGGAERSLANVLLDRRGDRQDAHVVSLSGLGHYGEILGAHGIPVDPLELNHPSRLLSAPLRLYRIVERFRPDVIQGWMYHGNLIASLASLIAGPDVPVAWNIRQSLYDLGTEKRGTQKVIRLLAKLSARPDAIVYNSFQARDHHETFGFGAERSVVIPNGFDAGRWRPDPAHRQATRSALAVGDADIVVGFVGRYHPIKDVPTFLAASALAMATDPRVHVALVGEGLNADNPALAAHFARLPVDRVHVLGRRGDIESIMPGFDMLCLSSASEGFPNVLGEAMASALPCIATDVGDCVRVMNGHGLIVGRGDVVAMANAITDLARLSPEQRQEIGMAARERIVTGFGFDATLDAYSRLYDSLIKRED
ncbi:MULTISPECIES: glycosyltransferase [unclassified Sphingopyxis]|uniref:glycosyltransferase n=1 Tax=unclassified Sphingopyxis TaxID=2614943 RepID=UPI00285B7C2B|nr:MULTISPECIES: glycosyltransferase [unclassified Sphingopyxis]MDR7227776.1 glycosyltransferase involved in cell wall biosynthesis [Sphingopyxis sp. BE259]